MANATTLMNSRKWSAEIVGELLVSSNFLVELLHNSLDISKLEAGKLELNYSFEDVKEVVTTISKINKTNADKRGLSILVVPTGEIPSRINIDRSRLAQVIMNLVTNAVKFSRERTTVRISVSWMEKVERSALESSDGLAITKTVKRTAKSPKSILEDRISKETTGISMPEKMVRRKSCVGDTFEAELQRLKGYEEKKSYLISVIPDEAPSTTLHVSVSKMLEAYQNFPIRNTFGSIDRNYNPNNKKLKTMPSSPTAGQTPLRIRDFSSAVSIPKKQLSKRTSLSARKFQEPHRLSSDQVHSASRGGSSKELTPVEGTLLVCVSDEGCGMAKEEIERLFKPFAQANKSIHSKFGGTGLGLWLSYKLVKAMGGNIKCTSEVGRGSTFIVEIPTKSKHSDEPQKVMFLPCFSGCYFIKS